jgi:stage V sporulation protein AD
VLTNEECKIKIKAVCVGKVQDLGIKDQNNMGAAMAPAAANTIKEFFKDTATTADDYDAIFTGDLGAVGSELMYRLLEKEKINVRHLHKDCGNLIFNPKTQSNINSGGSGCGCSASVLCSYILGGMQTGKLKDVLFVATGAMLSPTSVMQGQNVPSIAHLVYLSAQ